jgi:hypothetical protein
MFLLKIIYFFLKKKIADEKFYEIHPSFTTKSLSVILKQNKETNQGQILLLENGKEKGKENRYFS